MINIQHYSFQNLRQQRQIENIQAVFMSIEKNDLSSFKSVINGKELERTLTEENLSLLDFWSQLCALPHLGKKGWSRNLSIDSSRQGSKDEHEQLKVVNRFSEQYGVKITQLNKNDFRPTDEGDIVSKTEYQARYGKQKNYSHKSFDGRIEGKISGFISAKVVYGDGGHQDNVFKEMDTTAEWWVKYNREDYLVLLIDTNRMKQFQEIKNKYNVNKNIIVVNHVELQEHIANNFTLE